MNPFGNTRDKNFSWMGLPSDWLSVTASAAGTGQLGNAPAGSPSAGTPVGAGIAVVSATAGTVVVRTPWGDDRTITLLESVPFSIAVGGIKTGGTLSSVQVAVVY
jgi:hypothetical protein